MKESGTPVTKILVTLAILFSLYTVTIPWVRVNPVLSEVMSLAESSNNVAADGISAIIGTVTSLFDSEDASKNNESNGISEAGNAVIKALSDEKEIVGILSKGKCTPYDCSRIFNIVGTYADDETMQTIYWAVSWLFYVICALGVLAIVLILTGRYVCSIIYACFVALDMLMITSAISGVNETLNVSAFSLMDSVKIAGAAAGAVVVLAFVGIASAENNQEGRNTHAESRRENYKAHGKGTARRNEEDEYHRLERMKRQKVILGMLISASVIIIAAAGIYTFVKKSSPVTVDLSTYASLRITGYDEYGKASCDFSEDIFLQDIKKLLLDKNSGSGDKAMSEEYAEQIAWEVYEDMKILLSDEKGLRNGEKVSLDVTMNPEAMKTLEQFHVKAVFSDVHIVQEVKGLPEVQSYDPFKDIDVEFRGAEPYGEAIVSYSGDYGDCLQIDADPCSDLRNGDEVEITVLSEYDKEELVEECGIRLSRDTKTIAVSGLLYFPDRIDELQPEELSRISDTAQRIAREYIADEYESDEQLAGLTSSGQYFASAEVEDAQFHNQMYCIYEVNYANTSGKAETYYYYVRLENIMIDPKTEEAVVDYEQITVPQKPSLSADTLNLSEFVIVRFLPPRILSGFSSKESFYNNYILPLEETCTVSESGGA